MNGLNLYYEIHGAGEPLVLLHGGFGVISMFGEILPQLANIRQVIAVELQGHGHTADIDRPLRYELLGDDIAALITHLGFDKADVMGYSLGAGTALRTAIQHPEVVRKLVLVSTPFKRSGWYPEIVASMDQMSAATAQFMYETPMYQSYVGVAPNPAHFPVLCDKLGDLLRQEYDWSNQVAALKMPTLLIYGDADSMPPSHAAQFFELLGGGKADGGWDGAAMPPAQLAILPATTHYNIFSAPALASTVMPFLNRSMPQVS